MKFSKKALALLLALTTCLSVLSILPAMTAQAAIVKLPNYYFSQDFDSLGEGEVLSEKIMTTSAGSDRIGAHYDEEADSMVMRYEALPRNNTSGSMLVAHDAGKTGYTGNVVIDFDIKFEDWDNATAFILHIYNAAKQADGHVLKIDSNGTVIIGGVETGARLMTKGENNKFQTVSFVVDTYKHTADVYIDYVKRASGSWPISITDLCVIRWQLQYMPIGSEMKMSLDNLKVYEGTKPLKPEEIAKIEWASSADAASGSNTLPQKDALELMKNKTGFYPDAYYGVANGKLVTLKDNQKAYKEGDALMVPLSVAAKGVNGITNPVQDNSVTAVLLGKEAVFTDGSNIVKVDGKDVEMPAAAKLRNGEIMVPIKTLAEICERYLFTEEFGLNVMSQTEVYWDWSVDLPSVNGVIDLLCFERPTAEQMLNDAAAKWKKGEHPRLYATAEDYARIREEIKTSPIKQKWYEEANKTMEGLLNRALTDYADLSTNHTGQGSFFRDSVMPMALWYQVTGDVRYADRVWEHMQNLINQPIWYNGGSWQALGWSRGTYAFCVSLDALWNYLTEEQRKNACDALINAGVKTSHKIVAGGKSLKTVDNWASMYGVCSLAMAAVCFDESEDYRKEVERHLDLGFRFFETCASLNAPDGAYWEGTGYYNSQAEQFPFGMQILKNTFGNYYGLDKVPGHTDLFYWPHTLTGYQLWGYNHSQAEFISSAMQPYAFWAAAEFDDPALAALRYKTMLEFNMKGTWEDIMTCVGDPDVSKVEGLELDNYTRVEEIVTTRDSYDTYSSFFVGIHGGLTRDMQYHNDAGNFIIQSFGDKFFYEHPTLNYNLPGFGHTMYSYRAEGHNTLLINPPEEGEPVETHDQEWYALAPVTRYESNEVSMVTEIDLTPAYGSRAISVHRGLKMTNGRSMAIIQDEIVLEPGSEVYWSAHVPLGLTAEVSEDGKTAIVSTPTGNRLACKILSEQGKFEFIPAVPIPTSPQMPAELEFQKDYRKLQIHEDNIDSFNVTVAFSPLAYESKKGITYPEVTPMAEWTLDDPESVEIAEIPYLDEIKINGAPMKNFSQKRTGYEIGMKSRVEPVPTVEATAKDGIEVTVNLPESIPGYITIDASNEFYTNTYRISYLEALPSLADVGYEELELEVYDVGADAEDAPIVNTLDNNFTTRYSYQIDLGAWVSYDLGEIKTFDTLSMSLYGGDIRKLYFDVYVSNDGAEWRKLDHEFISSGENDGTASFENFDLGTQTAQYIKIVANGLMRNNEDTMATNDLWFSPQEVKLFKKP